MAGTREASLGIVAGKKGVGKTYRTIMYLEDYVRGNPYIGVKGRKVLILDANDEYAYKAISLDNIARFSSHPTVEIRRVRPFNPDGSVMKNNDLAAALEHIIQNYKGGLLLIEDISKYISDSMPNDVIGAICTNRHRACDILIHVQSIGRIVPKVWQNATWVRFHKHTESVDKSEGKLSEFYEVFKLVEYMVNEEYNNNNERFFLHIDLDKVKIKGAYTRDMFLKAIYDYVQDNYNRLMRPLLNRVDLVSGKKVHTPATAFKQLRDGLYLQYYGN